VSKSDHRRQRSLARAPAQAGLATASLAALGIVFGDLGTSPLYTLQTIVEATGGRFTPESALGILSLIVWTLIVTVSIKYGLFVMRADNHGEGGILALMALIGADGFRGREAILTGMGLMGAALIYGDGVITPAISVLSALEGVNVVTPTLKPFIMPVAVMILLGLFFVQRFGSGAIGKAFGPVMLIWFAVIAVLGLSGILREPIVLTAINPICGLRYLLHSGASGPLILGGVFLCITGAEALYADMGHFGRFPIRLSWYGVVLPALLLSYAGQTALLLGQGAAPGNPFFQLAPHWAIYPLVILSTVATIIASQAIITGAFSMTRQAMQLGWLPGVHIRQTSDEIYGQIYVPVVNWLMMIATVGITIAFQTSARLAGAYGSAVSTTMLLTTGLLFSAMVRVWKWPLAAVIAVAGLFFMVDFAFFVANLLKVFDGGWVPLALGMGIFFLMTTWGAGLNAVRTRLARTSATAEGFQALVGKVPRVPGTAIFLTRSNNGMPNAIVEHVKFMGALQEHVIALTVIFEQTPRVASDQRCQLEDLSHGIVRVTLRFGFIEAPDLNAALCAVQGLPEGADVQSALFFAMRDLVTGHKARAGLPVWRLSIFAFLYHNAVKVVDRFNLPASRVLEVARQIEI
jgi:KUP system potassium uptake protein